MELGNQFRTLIATALRELSNDSNQFFYTIGTRNKFFLQN